MLAWLTAIVLHGPVVVDSAAAAAGDLDPSFSTNGMLLVGRSGPADVDVDAKGRTVILRRFADRPALTRLTRSGRKDPSFGDHGVARIDFGPGEDSAAALERLDDGGYLVIGNSIADFSVLSLARLTADGSLATSYGDDGIATYPLDRPATVNDAAMDSQGRVTITGRLSQGEASSWFVARVMPSGDLDPSFSGDGWLIFDDDPGAGFSIALDGLDRSLIARTAAAADGELSFGVVRLLEDGQMDPAYGAAGVASPTGVSAFEPGALTADADGNALLTAVLGADFAVSRISPSGQLDATFGDGGVARVPFAHRVARPAWVGSDTDGRVLVAGWARDNSEDVGIARLKATGMPDPSFGSLGTVTTPFGLPGYLADEAAVAADLGPRHTLTVVGTFDESYGTTVSRYRLKAGGRHDLDADDVRDARDRCPHIYGPPRSGCPKFDSTVSIDYTGRKFRGHVRPEERLCSEVSDRVVSVYRELPGRDRRLARTELRYPSYWEINALNRRGRYYAVAERTVDPDVGACLQARSATIEIRSRRRAR